MEQRTIADLFLPKPLLTWLRGEHKSMRYRFWTLPKEWVTYWIYRATGRSWIDFYSNRLDNMANSDRQRSGRPSEVYLDQAQSHFEFLKANGLKPDHALLDYGCGVLRLGLKVIPYLGENRYVGVDISSARIETGRQLLRDAGIADDVYKTIVVTDCKLEELADHRFDVVWAKSVFTHMPHRDIVTALRALRPLLEHGARFFFTFTPSDKLRRKKTKDFYHPVAVMQDMCVAEGYMFSLAPDWDQDLHNDVMACLRLPPDAS